MFTKQLLAEIILLCGWGLMLLAGLDLALFFDPNYTAKLNAPSLAGLGCLVLMAGRLIKD